MSRLFLSRNIEDGNGAPGTRPLLVRPRCGVRSLPLFFSKEELLEFATPVYGAADAKERVLLTDLAVVVSNMVNGPAGLLRDAKFFAPAPSLTGMDRLEANQKQDVFGLQGSLEAYREREQGLFGGMKMPWT